MKLDISQQAVLAHCAPACALSVTGAAGSGKTFTLRQAVKHILVDNPQARIVVLSPDRLAATDLRNTLSLDLEGLPENISVQSITAFAFSLVSLFAQNEGRKEPELISGAEQDFIIKETFTLMQEGLLPELSLNYLGNVSSNIGDSLAFRTEFRELITRATQLGISAKRLAELGKKYDMPAWNVGAQLLSTYQKALATQSSIYAENPDRIDHAHLLVKASEILRSWSQAPMWDWVFVDDLQNATLSLIPLLQELQAQGAGVVTFGNSDLAVHGFRGGLAQLPILTTFPKNRDGLGAHELSLTINYRANKELVNLAQKIEAKIHLSGHAAHRKYTSLAATKPVEDVGEESIKACAFPNLLEEITYVARWFQELHLGKENIPYSQMAIITRSNADHKEIRNILVRLGVPVAPVHSNESLLEQVAVAELLELFALVTSSPQDLRVADIERILTGELFGCNALFMRQLRAQLRSWEVREYGGKRTENELLKLLVCDPHNELFQNIKELAPIINVLAKVHTSRVLCADQALWEVWEALNIAEKWQRLAFSTDVLVADRVNANLDAIMQLFRIAQRLTERNPADASIEKLLAELRAQELGEDSIAPTSANRELVTLLTPSATIGRSWEYVAVLNLNDGVWPNIKLRNPLSKVTELVGSVVAEKLAGNSEVCAQSYDEVIDDELRMLLQSVTRAHKALLLASLDNEISKPASFMDYLTADSAENKLSLQQIQYSIPPLEIENLVGLLRQAQLSDNAELSVGAQNILQELSASGVWDSEFMLWEDDLALSSTNVAYEDPIYISPSVVESYLNCPLATFLDRNGAGRSDSRLFADIGTLIHSIAEKYPRGGYENMNAELEARWGQLNLDESLYYNQRFKDAMLQMLKNYDEYASANSAQVYTELKARYTGVMDSLDEDRAEYIITARIDRLEYDIKQPDVLQVADLKTGQMVVGKVEALTNPQLSIYQWLVNEQAVELPESVPSEISSGGAKLVYLGKEKLQERTQPATTNNATRVVELLREVISLQKQENFAALGEESKCRSCQYRWLCPKQEGQRIFS